MDYYDGKNHPLVNHNGYLCDKCKLQPLIEWEYDNCVRSGDRYCLECFNYLHIRRWKDDKGIHSLRSERLFDMTGKTIIETK